MILKEAFDQPYNISVANSRIVDLLKSRLKHMGCTDIQVHLVDDIKKTNIFIISYVYDGAIETHIVNENLIMGGKNEKSDMFKKSEFSRLIATSIMITSKMVKNKNLPVRFWSDDERKTNIYKNAISRFKDVDIVEEKNYTTINGDTRTVNLIVKKVKD